MSRNASPHVIAAAASFSDREMCLFLLGALEAVSLEPRLGAPGLRGVLDIGRAHLFPDESPAAVETKEQQP